MKKIIGIILSLALIVSCAAFAEEDGQSIVMNIIGDYSDEMSQRAVMHIECGDQTDVADVQVNWANGADETYVWNFSGLVEEQGNGFVMRYSDCVKSIAHSDSEDAEGTVEVVYENGTGTLTCDEENNITWQDDVENAGVGCVFVFDGSAEESFGVAGVQIDASEADLRATLGEPAEEKGFEGGKELIYNGIQLAGYETEAHFFVMDDMVRAMGFVTHEGNSDVANDISVFMDNSGNDTDAEVTEERVTELAGRYFGIEDLSQLTYFSRYAKDGSEMVYIRISENDIYLLVLDHYLQEN